MEIKKQFSKFFLNYIYSGKEWNPIERQQISFINGFTVVCVSSLIVFGVYQMLIAEYIPAVVELIIALVAILNVWFLRKNLSVTTASKVVLILTIIIMTFLLIDGGIAHSGLYWVYLFPTFAFFLFGDRIGLTWILALLIVFIAVVLANIMGLVNLVFSLTLLRQALISYLAFVASLFVYTKFSAINIQMLEKHKSALENTFKVKEKEIEEKAQRTKELLMEKIDTFFRTTGDLMGIVNREGYLTEINPAFSKSLGYSFEELTKIHFIELVHPDDVEKIKEVMQKLFQGNSVSDIIIRNRKKDGEYIWLMWNATPKGEIIYATARIVNDLVGAQDELKSKLEEFEKLNKYLVGRELKMIEMKEELAMIKKGTGSD